MFFQVFFGYFTDILSPHPFWKISGSILELLLGSGSAMGREFSTYQSLIPGSTCSLFVVPLNKLTRALSGLRFARFCCLVTFAINDYFLHLVTAAPKRNEQLQEHMEKNLGE